MQHTTQSAVQLSRAHGAHKRWELQKSLDEVLHLLANINDMNAEAIAEAFLAITTEVERREALRFLSSSWERGCPFVMVQRDRGEAYVRGERRHLVLNNSVQGHEADGHDAEAKRVLQDAQNLTNRIVRSGVFAAGAPGASAPSASFASAAHEQDVSTVQLQPPYDAAASGGTSSAPGALRSGAAGADADHSLSCWRNSTPLFWRLDTVVVGTGKSRRTFLAEIEMAGAAWSFYYENDEYCEPDAVTPGVPSETIPVCAFSALSCARRTSRNALQHSTTVFACG